MSRPPLATAWALALCVAGLLVATAAGATAIDPAVSEIGFSLRTRWGQVLEGHFPRYEGEIDELPDGRRQVRLRLSTRDVEIVGNTSYTRLTRGAGFFDAEHYPQIEFVSDPYPLSLLQAGGALDGNLSIRGVRRRESFLIEPSPCAQPALECDVVANGSIDRNDYDVDRWTFALSSRVVFHLRVRVHRDE